jgi:phosphoesterase RecJ-like protein
VSLGKKQPLVRVGEAAATISKIPTIINIDHHVSNTGFGHIQLVDTTACATAEIVYRLIKALEIPFDKAMATSLYTGILTDTGSFRFSNTNKAAFRISKEMTAAGVDPHGVAQQQRQIVDDDRNPKHVEYNRDEHGRFRWYDQLCAAH